MKNEKGDIKLCYWTQDKIEKLLTIDNARLVRWNFLMVINLLKLLY